MNDLIPIGINVASWFLGAVMSREKSAGVIGIAANAPELRGPAAVEKVYFIGPGNSASHMDMTIFGSNAARALFSIGSSATNAAHAGIIARQCGRAQQFIANELRALQWDEDDDGNENVLNRIRAAIDLVGEPAIYAAYQELVSHRGDNFVFGKLLHVLSMAKDENTERHRVNMLLAFSHDPNVAVRYSAVEGLGNMATHSESAKVALRKISGSEGNSEIANMAAVYSR